jgi:hypothetical protein
MFLLLKVQVLTTKDLMASLLDAFRLFKLELSKIISTVQKEVKELKEKRTTYENKRAVVVFLLTRFQ